MEDKCRFFTLGPFNARPLSAHETVGAALQVLNPSPVVQSVQVFTEYQNSVFDDLGCTWVSLMVTCDVRRIARVA
jgi:hypothetical protein